MKLSLMNVSGNPFLAGNRHKASISVGVDMSGVSSKCVHLELTPDMSTPTPTLIRHLVVAHVNNNIYMI